MNPIITKALGVIRAKNLTRTKFLVAFDEFESTAGAKLLTMLNLFPESFQTTQYGAEVYADLRDSLSLSGFPIPRIVPISNEVQANSLRLQLTQAIASRSMESARRILSDILALAVDVNEGEPVRG